MKVIFWAHLVCGFIFTFQFNSLFKYKLSMEKRTNHIKGLEIVMKYATICCLKKCVYISFYTDKDVNMSVSVAYVVHTKPFYYEKFMSWLTSCNCNSNCNNKNRNRNHKLNKCSSSSLYIRNHRFKRYLKFFL